MRQIGMRFFLCKDLKHKLLQRDRPKWTVKEFRVQPNQPRNLLQLYLVALILSVSLSSSSFATDQLFVKLKCTKCHAISAYNIEKKPQVQDEEEEQDDEPMNTPDLSNIGKLHDSTFLKAFLMKEIKHKPHPENDREKKHKVKFKGSADELKEIVEWLSTLQKNPTDI